MSYQVSPDLSKVTLNESDYVRSVLQNIAIILATRQGTVPLYREFGLPMRFVDKPMPVAKTLLVAEITEALAEYEPRAKVLNVDFVVDAATPGKLIPTVEVEINAEES